ncbi:MAG: hypothetical protein K8W52_23830 [Deltaproteobacteria bacterium]|nr:hypothetical protein [Deltaproteobacteria bacterium]
MPPGGCSRVVLACGIVTGLVARGAPRAHADDASERWQADVSRIGAVFHFDRDRVAQAADLAEHAPLTCTDIVDVTEYDVLRNEPARACTGSIATADRDVCRMAAITALTVHRQGELRTGEDGSVAFALTCEGYVVSGTWYAYGTITDSVNGTLIARTSTPDGSQLDSDSLQVPWKKLPPDPDRPSQWIAGVLVPVTEAQAVLARVQRAIAAGGPAVAAQGVEFVDGELHYVRQEIAGFAAPGDGEAVRAAALAWLDAVAADLDHGDLKAMIDLAAIAHPRAADKRKAKAILARYRKAAARRLRPLEKAVDAFMRAHDLD